MEMRKLSSSDPMWIDQSGVQRLIREYRGSRNNQSGEKQQHSLGRVLARMYKGQIVLNAGNLNEEETLQLMLATESAPRRISRQLGQGIHYLFAVSKQEED